MKLNLKKQRTRISKIRSVGLNDIDPLARLMLESYRGTIDYHDETIDDARKELQKIFDGENGPLIEDCSYVIEEKNTIISATIIILFNKIDKPLLSFSMTHPSYKNQGYSTDLIKHSINSLIENGYDELFLVVTEGNEPAQHLYEKLG